MVYKEQSNDWSWLINLWWVPIAALLMYIDFKTDPRISFSQFYIFPVGLAAWYSGKLPALVLAIVFSGARWFLVSNAGVTTAEASLINGLIRLVVLWSFALLVVRVRRDLSLARDLKILQGLVPVCSYCQRIRGQGDVWQSFDHYVSTRSGTDPTQGVCPDCAAQYYKESFDRR